VVLPLALVSLLAYALMAVLGIGLKVNTFPVVALGVGIGVIFTGCTLAFRVCTWIFSPLQFQADMGILLTFLFLVNILGAILLLLALARWLLSAIREAA